MREIKFRAWQDNGMVYQPMSGNYAATRFFGFLYEDAPTMQFTGLKDKNGIEIWEGDIVKVHYFYEALGEGLGVYEAEKEITGEIAFQEMGLWIECGNKEEGGYLLLINGLHEESFEVIGNIYENPELLK
jgi:uncharacterized phage protein (TIGR01671 family)